MRDWGGDGQSLGIEQGNRLRRNAGHRQKGMLGRQKKRKTPEGEAVASGYAVRRLI